MTGETGAARATRVAATAIACAGLVVVALITLAAAARLGDLVDRLWAGFPRDIGWSGVLIAVLLAAGMVGVVRLVVRLDEERLAAWMPWAPLLLLVAIRAVIIPLIETPLPPDSDPLFLHELAVGVLDGGNPLVAHRPMGFSTMLAALYAVFGVHPWLAELLNLLLAVFAGWMLYRLVLGGWGPRTAGTAVTLYAVAPSQVLLVTTLFTETAYAAFLLAAMALAAGAVRMRSIAIGLAAGALLAASQYVRPMSQAFLSVFVVLPFLSGLRLRRAASITAAVLVAFLVVLAPIAFHNAMNYGALSLSTSSYGGWSIFVGANQEHDGRFNEDDQAILADMEGSVWERSEILGREGIERITSDPKGFAYLSVRKFYTLWGNDIYAVGAALRGSTVTDNVRGALMLISQAAYTILLVFAAAALWRVRLRPPPEALLLAGVIFVVAATHTFLEVQARYHAYTVPLLCALAAPAIVAGISRRPTPEAASV